MRLSQKLSRLAATFMATAMLACTAALPASANTGVWGGTGNSAINDNSIELVTTLAKRVGVLTPDVYFKVTVAGAAPTSEMVGGIAVQQGPADSASTTELVHFVDTDGTEAASSSVGAETDGDGDNTVTITFDTTKFTAPGIYKYSVTESIVNASGVAATYEGITCDNAYMYVYIEENGLGSDSKMTYRVANVVLTTQNTTTGKIAALTNRYGVDDDGDPDNTVNNLLVTKKVEGNQGDKTKDFTFTVTATTCGDNDTFRVIKVTKKQNPVGNEDPWQETGEAKTLSKGHSVEMTLKDGETFRVYGLSASDVITVEESAADEYTTYTNSSFEDTDTYKNSTALDGGTDDDIQAGYSWDDEIAYDKRIGFHNVRVAATPTGVVMNVAPYILLVVIAVAGAFVFLRKRRED